jgi:eukaryotic-like serine/threonine-protein kinase
MADLSAPEPYLRLQVGKYDVQKLLGKGSTGTVYLAIDTFTGREVALKTLEPEVFRDPEFGAVHRTQFLNEASLAGKLRHPHIVSILDAVVGEDSGHIAMELVPGGDLSQHVRPDKLLAVADVLQIGFKCCRAMEYAYREQRIVHRDLKPSNIMISRGTDIKIADFGAAFLKKGSAAQTAAVGSPFYMAPEQMQGREPTLHSDMYSLGVVLYELLVGRRPFEGQTLDALIRESVRSEPVPPSKARNGLPKDLDPVVLRALRKDPAERYATWAQFGMELARLTALVLPHAAVADSEKYLSLSSVDMLKQLTDSELWELVGAGRWQRLEKATTMVREDTTGQSLFFLAKGQAKVTKQGRLLNVIKQGECFGEMAFIRGGHEPRHATVESTTEVLLAEFVPAALEHVSQPSQLHLTRALVRNTVERLALANARLAR